LERSLSPTRCTQNRSRGAAKTNLDKRIQSCYTVATPERHSSQISSALSNRRQLCKSARKFSVPGGALESLNELRPTTPEKLVVFEGDVSPSARVETAANNFHQFRQAHFCFRRSTAMTTIRRIMERATAEQSAFFRANRAASGAKIHEFWI
jgi:hypothetical protein